MKLSTIPTKYMGAAGIILGLASIAMGLWVDFTSGLVMAAATFLVAIAMLLRSRQGQEGSGYHWATFVTLGLGLIGFAIPIVFLFI